MKKLVVLGANEPLERFYEQSKQLGYYLIGIAHENGAVCKKYCDKFYPISFVDKEAILEVCRSENINGITSFSLESALPTVIYIAESLGLVSNSFECAEKLKNKFTMRECFADNGISNPKYKILKAENELTSVNIPFPCIVKPVDSGGSQGVTKVNSSIDLQDAFRRALEYSRDGSVIVEEFIDGREFSVEYISHKGSHHFVQITDKVTSGEPYFIELEHHQPAQLEQKLVARIKRLVEDALNALHVENTPSHTEIKLDSKGNLYIIEVGARMGGDYISSDLVRLSTGYDFVKGAIDLALGEFQAPKQTEKNYSGIYFYSSITPHIKQYIQLHQNDPLVVKAHLNKIENDYCYKNGDRNGYFIYQSDKKFCF